MNTSNITNYKPNDFVALIDVSVATLQRWDRENISIVLATTGLKKFVISSIQELLLYATKNYFPTKNLHRTLFPFFMYSVVVYMG